VPKAARGVLRLEAYDVGEHGECIKKTLASGDVLVYAYNRRGCISEATTTTEDSNVSTVERSVDLLGAGTSDQTCAMGSAAATEEQAQAPARPS